MGKKNNEKQGNKRQIQPVTLQVTAGNETVRVTYAQLLKESVALLGGVRTQNFDLIIKLARIKRTVMQLIHSDDSEFQIAKRALIEAHGGKANERGEIKFDTPNNEAACNAEYAKLIRRETEIKIQRLSVADVRTIVETGAFTQVGIFRLSVDEILFDLDWAIDIDDLLGDGEDVSAPLTPGAPSPAADLPIPAPAREPQTT